MSFTRDYKLIPKQKEERAIFEKIREVPFCEENAVNLIVEQTNVSRS